MDKRKLRPNFLTSKVFTLNYESNSLHNYQHAIKSENYNEMHIFSSFYFIHNTQTIWLLLTRTQ